PTSPVLPYTTLFRSPVAGPGRPPLPDPQLPPRLHHPLPPRRGQTAHGGLPAAARGPAGPGGVPARPVGAAGAGARRVGPGRPPGDRKSTRLNSSHVK